MNKESWITTVSRIRSLFRRGRMEDEMVEEMRHHMEELTRANIEAGMPPEEARFAAQRRFGSVTQLEERCRDERGFVWLGQMANDATFTLRSLFRSTGFTLTVIGTLVLGIGLSTAVFNLTSSDLLFELPYPNPGQLLKIGYSDPQDPGVYWIPRFQFLSYRDQTSAFSEFAVARPRWANVTILGEPVDNQVLEITAGTFETLGVRPVLGRGFLPGEFRDGQNQVAVISDLYWRKYFNAAKDVIGRTVMVNQRAFTVVGVLAPERKFPDSFGANLFCPTDLKGEPDNIFMMLAVLGRLKDGVTKEQAEAQLAASRLPPLPGWVTDYLAHQRPVARRLTEVERPGHLWVIMAAGMFLFGISCLNVMNLMLIRLLGRRRELSIRFAIGGSRLQVIRLLLIESMFLSGSAGLAVALLVKWVFPPLFSALDGNDAAYYRNFWDWSTLACVFGLSILACVGAVLIPTFRVLAADINSGLKDGGPKIGESPGASKVRNLLVVIQAAFAVILLIGTGLMVSSFERLHHIDLGFDPSGKVKVQVQVPEDYPLKPEERVRLFERLQERMKTIPGVRDASFSQDSVFTGFFSGSAELLLEDGTTVPTAGNFVSPEYQKTAGLFLKEGRWLSGVRGQDEAVINESFAKARFGGRDPIGLSFKLKVSGDKPLRVVGVVKNVRDSVRHPAGIRFYVPYWMYPNNIDSVLLRMDSDPKKEFATLIYNAVSDIDPRLIVLGVNSIHDIVGNAMSTERFAFMILKGLAVVAFGLTLVGIFSVISYSVDSRMNEFGVRLALGATSRNLKTLVIKKGLGAVSLGLVIGIFGAIALTHFMENLLFETKPFDPAVYVAVAGALIVASVAACWLPARRASRADVVRLLRSG